MTLVDSVEAGRLTISELIDATAKDKNYTASRWYQRYRAFTTLLQQTSTLLSLQQMVWSNSFGMSVTTALQVFAVCSILSRISAKPATA